jgi:hypothetical protein
VLPVFRRDQAEAFQPLDGPVDLAFVDVPGHAHAAVRGQQGSERESAHRFLADQAQHQPLGQRQSRPVPSRHGGSSPRTAQPRPGWIPVGPFPVTLASPDLAVTE